MNRRDTGVFLVAALIGCGAASGQSGATVEAPLLRVELADGAARTFTRTDLERIPAESAEARLRDGQAFTVTGVSVTTLLELAGLDLGANLGGAAVVGHALVARAADGYVAVFGLAEVDPHFGRAPLMVVWKNADGSALRPGVGPVQLINAGESRSGRWVRQLEVLEVKALR
ncbi:MAG TPA: hypothetical protein VF308_00310 [Caldimonas sp.]